MVHKFREEKMRKDRHVCNEKTDTIFAKCEDLLDLSDGEIFRVTIPLPNRKQKNFFPNKSISLSIDNLISFERKG